MREWELKEGEGGETEKKRGNRNRDEVARQIGMRE